LDEFLHGLDPTEADTDADGLPDGFELANACLNAQARDSGRDPDNDGQSSLDESTWSDPCLPGPAVPAGPSPATPAAATPAAPPPSGKVGPFADEGGGPASWWYALAGAAALVVTGGLVFLGKARRRG